jgi:hypothetical protein
MSFILPTSARSLSASRGWLFDGRFGGLEKTNIDFVLLLSRQKERTHLRYCRGELARNHRREIVRPLDAQVRTIE